MNPSGSLAHQADRHACFFPSDSLYQRNHASLLRRKHHGLSFSSSAAAAAGHVRELNRLRNGANAGGGGFTFGGVGGVAGGGGMMAATGAANGGIMLTEYNPNYEFGGGTCTLQDLREIPRENLRLVK